MREEQIGEKGSIPGHPELAVDCKWRGLEPGGRSDPASIGKAYSRDFKEDKPAKLLRCRGPWTSYIAGNDCGSMRHTHSEAEKLGDEWGWSRLECGAKSGVGSTERPVLSCRAETREAIRENRGREEQKTRSEARPRAKGDSRHSSWREEEKGKGKEGKSKGKKGKEKGEGKRSEK